MQTIANTLSLLGIGEAVTFEGLTIFPLLAESPLCEKGYLVLDEALRQGHAQVSEVSDSGTVSRLLFKNNGARKVLLIDGDELVGAKQNRIINLTILVPADSELEIPVSCVEQGRWSRGGNEFRPSKNSMHFSTRARKVMQVTDALRQSGDRDSDQSEIWRNLSNLKESLDVDSGTDAMSDMYDKLETELNRYRKAFQPVQNQVGMVFAFHGKIQGLEIFDSNQACAHYMARLVSSYALGIFSDDDKSTMIMKGDVENFIEKINNANFECFDAIGEGEDLRLSGEEVAGGALVTGSHIVHLAAFDICDRKKHRTHRARHYYEGPLH